MIYWKTTGRWDDEKLQGRNSVRVHSLSSHWIIECTQRYHHRPIHTKRKQTMQSENSQCVTQQLNEFGHCNAMPCDAMTFVHQCIFPSDSTVLYAFHWLQQLCLVHQCAVCAAAIHHTILYNTIQPVFILSETQSPTDQHSDFSRVLYLSVNASLWLNVHSPWIRKWTELGVVLCCLERNRKQQKFIYQQNQIKATSLRYTRKTHGR